MSKKATHILEGILFILIIAGFIYVGTRDFSQNTTLDNDKFDLEYSSVNSDNVFLYASSNEIYSLLKNGSAIIFMGFNTNIWSGYYAKILNDTAKEVGIDKILYYNFLADRKDKNATYQSIVLKLSKYIVSLDDDTKNIYAPSLVIVKNGNIIFYDDETSLTKGAIKPEDYWTDEEILRKTTELKQAFLEYLKTDVENTN